jgi:putative resolvase
MKWACSKAWRLLAGPGVQAVVAVQRDRFRRMNTELAESAVSAHWRRLVLDDGEVDHDLARGMAGVLTSSCTRLYGRRSARNRALKAIGCAHCDIGLHAVVSAGRQDADRE